MVLAPHTAALHAIPASFASIVGAALIPLEVS